MRNSKNWVIFGLAFFNIAIHLYAINNLEYHRDELLYFALGTHPDLGYATVPPLIGWIAAIMQKLFGYSLFAVKLFPALLGGALVVLAARITQELKGDAYAQILTAVAIVCMPVGLRAFHLFQPVPMELFLWTLILFYTLRYVNTDKPKYLLIVGFVTGIALLNKYLVALLILALLVALAITAHRRVFKVKSLYYAMLIAFLVFLPNLIWQYTHDFPVIGHMNALNENQLVYVDRFSFLADQLLMTFSVCFLLIMGIVHFIRSTKYRYLAYTAIVVVLVLLALKGKSYYTMGVFPALICGGCVAMEEWISNRWVRYAIPVVIVMITLPALPIGLPIYSEEGLVRYFQDLEEEHGIDIGRRFEDGTIHSLPQDYADQLGWEELTQITNEAYKLIPKKDLSKAVIYASNYGQAGAITVIGKKYELPEPVCFNESFFYWFPKKFDPDIEYLIYINDELGENVAYLFQDIELIGAISNPNAREFGTAVYLCRNPRSSFNEFWAEVLESVEDPF